MSRELKFRVYIPDFGKMVYFDLGCFDYSDRYLYQDKYPVQQYTGLTDSKGNHIYEGDILNQVCDNKPCYYVVEWGNKSSYCGFVLRPLMKRDGTFTYTTHNFAMYLNECFEIIGNIFKNSELLK